jgi:hypothetical protein
MCVRFRETFNPISSSIPLLILSGVVIAMINALQSKWDARARVIRMNNTVPIRFTAVHTVLAARVQDFGDLPRVVRDLGLPTSRPVIVPIGGAGGVMLADLDRLRPLFDEALAPLAEELGAVVVDGGTDAGILRLMGQARASRQFPLVGVVVEQLAALPSRPLQNDQWMLEPHHTHFVFTPGSHWGEEAIWISRLATALDCAQPSVTVLINGGEIAYKDVAHSLEQQRPVIVIEGSGRTADVLATALHEKVKDKRAEPLVASGLLTSVRLADGPSALRIALNRLLHSV